MFRSGEREIDGNGRCRQLRLSTPPERSISTTWGETRLVSEVRKDRWGINKQGLARGNSRERHGSKARATVPHMMSTQHSAIRGAWATAILVLARHFFISSIRSQHGGRQNGSRQNGSRQQPITFFSCSVALTIILSRWTAVRHASISVRARPVMEQQPAVAYSLFQWQAVVSGSTRILIVHNIAG